MENDSPNMIEGSYKADWIKPFYTQAGIWWGSEPHDSAEEHIDRLALVNRLIGSKKLHVLDLGCGSGNTAAAFAKEGHDVVGVELNPTDIGYAQELLKNNYPGTLSIIEADYSLVELEDKFDLVTWWEGFGLGSDADQRKMLKRIADEWLKPNGSVLMDVYLPSRPARHAGEAVHLDALENVAGSVDMIEKSYYDVINARWIDEWQPLHNPEAALSQNLRCYSPADFLLLLEGTGLRIKALEIDDHVINIDELGDRMLLDHAHLEAWAFLVQLVLE